VAQAETFTPYKDPGAWQLKRQGFGPGARQKVKQLSATYPHVGLKAVLKDLNRDTGPLLSSVAPPGASGYSWEKGDNEVGYWTPQGFAGQGGVQAVSWYRGTPGHETDVRVSFTGAGKRHYRFALAVVPTGGSGFAHVPIHAGGMAWFGNYLYMADTANGFRVFDTSRLLHVPESLKGATGNYRYLLPQVGTYKSVGKGLKYSASALDASNPAKPALVAGEYRLAGDKTPTRIVRWPLNPKNGRLASGKANHAWKTGFRNLQGVTTNGGLIYVSSSATSTGQLYFGKPRQTAQIRPWGTNPEGLLVEGGALWSLTEPRYGRTVFAKPLGAL
jgi:hypothetical protein